MPSVRAILFDADGVIQRPSVDLRATCGAVLGLPAGDALDQFMRELFATEKPALTGHRDFVADLMEVLVRHGAAERLADTLAIWTAIETDPAMLEAITALRGQGVVCCLATNQQPYRGRYMSETLGYARLFDHEFYSHALGIAKPDVKYFQTIAERLALTPDELLFIDDHQTNIEGALAGGLQAAIFPGTLSTPAASSGDALRAILAAHGINL